MSNTRKENKSYLLIKLSCSPAGAGVSGGEKRKRAASPLQNGEPMDNVARAPFDIVYLSIINHPSCFIQI